MGLDMYLEGHVALIGFDEKTQVFEDGFRLTTKTYELAYWRKHPNLHGFIVQTFAEGKDDCEPIELDVEDLERVLVAVKADELPRTEGFFFGKSRPEDREPTIAVLEKAIAWLCNRNPDGQCKFVVYRASW
jgi:hypothetical protein